MTQEIRIYLADLSSWYKSSTDIENVVECAESQGTVWTLEQFVRQFNDGEEPLCSMLADTEGDIVMGGAIVEDGQIIKEIEG